jgi:endonuclease/exonuclease/phosphatase (EEP) superfamily protein YafD
MKNNRFKGLPIPLTRRSSSLTLLAAATVSWLVTACTTTPDPLAGECLSNPERANFILGPELPGELEVLSWNIQKASNTGWADDLAELGGGINLAFIQEASVQAAIPDAIGNLLHQTFAAGYTTDTMETGVMTLSSSAPSMSCNFTSWEPWLGTPKATSVTEYPLANRQDRLLAVNLHAVNFAIGLEDFQQQFDALDNLLSKHQGPIILAGDLNTWSGERQTLVNNFMDRYELSAVSFTPDLRTQFFGEALDHLYVRGMHAESARVIPVSTSDHNPLRVRLAFN